MRDSLSAFITVFIMATVLIPVVHAETNAARLALGLPPLRPKRLYAGTPVDTARKSKRSLAPLGTQYFCDFSIQPECCDNQVSDGDGGFTYTGCTATSSANNPFTCTDSQYALCANGDTPFFATTFATYQCPITPYTVIACCDPENTNDCVDPILDSGSSSTTSAFYCPNFGQDDDYRFPNCCTDSTYEHCANIATENSVG
ncbi:hypothetical protein CALVIDRAFT_597877 [Calocera viscosa TUFC12733]|uniref:Hydrophobin n=1 Tax=Calocera viscosa (strain TUFC12733) TaxID=1330018 RepID=A0A167MYF6_CALVF|nr:hypothetical protein CALVIDRAFT_597877 [Calocera viscosa TUFC12733]